VLGGCGERVSAVKFPDNRENTGIFGTGTAKAVKEYQEKNGLKADGVAGPVTLGKMSLMGITQATVRASLTPLGQSVWDTIQETTEGAFSKVKSVLGI